MMDAMDAADERSAGKNHPQGRPQEHEEHEEAVVRTPPDPA